MTTFIYFKNPETLEVYAYDQKQIDDGWVEPGLVPLTDEEVELHLNPPVTQEQLMAAAADKCTQCAQHAVLNITILQAGIDRERSLDGDADLLAAWQDYLCDLREMTPEQLQQSPAAFPTAPTSIF